MNPKSLIIIISLILCIFCFVTCTEKSLEVTPRPVTLNLVKPASLTDGENLGRILFYDTHLSVNNSISCASCHKQALAFSDNVAASVGFENNVTSRNAISIQNAHEIRNLFWDGREDNLQTMVLMPVVNHVEMGMSDQDALVERVRNTGYYYDLFEKTYGTADISADKIAETIRWFISNFTSTNNRFDQQQHGADVLTELEKEGRQLFMTKFKCNGCHRIENPSNGYGGGGMVTNSFINIGLDLNYADPGRENVTHDPADAGKFKVPSLRNIALTAPYMHDGRFTTLNQVLEHYSHNIQNHPNLDPLLKDTDGMPVRMNISSLEKTAIIAFLNALTDMSVIANPDFASPFLQ